MTIDHVYISGVKVDVVYGEAVDAEDMVGRYLPQQTRIELSPTLSGERARLTLIHEIIEAINELYDIDLKHHQINLLEAGLASTGLIPVDRRE